MHFQITYLWILSGTGVVKNAISGTRSWTGARNHS